MKPIYLVEHQGRRSRYFVECDRDSNSLQSIVDMIRSGELCPVKIIEVDEEAGTVENVTDEVMAAANGRPDDYRTPFTGQDATDWQNERLRALETV